VTGAQLRSAGFTTEYHVKRANGGYATSYVSCADPRVRMRAERAWACAPRLTTMFVGERSFAGDQWNEAAAALAALEKTDG
jgi:hypothetical protein